MLIKTCLVIFVVLSAIISVCFKPVFRISDAAYYAGTNANLILYGVVAREPANMSDKIRVIIEVHRLEYKGSSLYVKGFVLLDLPRYPEYSYGDCLRVNGILEKTGLGDFAYGDYLAKDDVYSSMYRPNVSVTGRGCGAPEWGVIYNVKSFINNRINGLFAEPAASLVSGLLLGIRRNIPADVISNFNKTGLTHIVAISGYNITLVISIFACLLKWAPRRLRFFATLSGIIFFVVLTGMSASVIRAAIMGFMVLVSSFIGRKTTGIQSLLWSAAIMSLLNPRIVLFDMSFQLSFLATLGILIFMPKFTAMGKNLKGWKQSLFEGFFVTVSAQVFATPLILYRYGLFSIIAPVANVIFLPLIPIIMLLSFLAMMISILIYPLGILFAWVCNLIITLLIAGVAYMANLPLAYVNIPFFSLTLMVIYYVTVFALLIIFRKPRLLKCSFSGHQVHDALLSNL